MVVPESEISRLSGEFVFAIRSVVVPQGARGGTCNWGWDVKV